MNPPTNPTNQANANGLSLPPVVPSSVPASQPAVPAPPPTAVANMTTPSTPANQDLAVDESGAPMIADDADLIEKAWVEKAKKLVEQTKNDPYTQNKEINKFKADYIKKRYNKDIQLNKD